MNYHNEKERQETQNELNDEVKLICIPTVITTIILMFNLLLECFRFRSPAWISVYRSEAVSRGIDLGTES